MRSHSRVVFVALAVAVVALPLGTTAVFAQWSAPGEPIFNCENAAARYERMGKGLPAQQSLIQRLQAQLAALDEAQATTDEEARDALVARSVDTVHSHASDELAALAEVKAKVLALPSHSTAQLRWIDKVSALEKEISALQKLTGTFRAGREYGLEIQSRSHTVAEHLKGANKLFVDSNLAEEIGAELAAAGGPLGVAAFEGSLFLLDYVVATEEGFIAERERNDLRETISNLQYGYDRVEDKMADLRRDCPAEFGEDPEPTIASASHLTPPPPESPSPEEEKDGDGLAVSTGAKSGKGGAAVLAIAGAGVAVAGGLYAGNVLSNMAETASDGGSCVSNRFCIVNSFSGGCSCSGSTRGECGWTGPTAGPGRSCGAGVPCTGGYSCNNGRCEGSSGRCPF